ncbi:MAG: isoprenylcysteine carboxylmethyltransferase family protein [Thalassolituus sp.]|jgi:protein-S-isoprenylcysteine O-methyltransferase Ste14|uniref:methyltransferase family protein n=1 Tax=Thalassolituus TaxID=187492 RepID=UPI00042DBD42|nr:isoprenylcysteine carboxylmethyltransferase family protein [Thalassolituus oleivorans]AHK15868.1 isoprenylcysteine carboxyl methyltransferase [Thalassolituus oleivorans R6-15]
MHGESSYGLWTLVILNSAIFIFFAFSFVKPKTKTDWRSLTAFSAFIVALFTEMYGFPLTIYFLSGWLAEKYPGVDFLVHENGHLLHTLFGFEGNAHFDPLHIASNLLIFLGFILLSSAWAVLHKAQQTRSLATSGWYARCRHPQYIAFILIMFGFLLQWPTIPTVVMFPILVWVYIRLARREEAMALAEFGDEYRAYQDRTPAWIPAWNVAKEPTHSH